MCRHLRKLLLLLITLVVAVAPLRGVWALPDMGTPDSTTHCTGMQHAMQPMDQHAGHGSKADGKSHKCKSGCNGACCDQDCSVCLHHTMAAMPTGVLVLRDTPVHTYRMPAADTFPERPPTPPLRPPLACHS
jgi:hypothetical protein